MLAKSRKSRLRSVALLFSTSMVFLSSSRSHSRTGHLRAFPATMPLPELSRLTCVLSVCVYSVSSAFSSAGCIAVCFVDLLRSCGAFTTEEANEYIKHGVLNGLFVLGRSIGFIGHFIDQRRLKQGLYRHPTEDISYLTSYNL